MADGLPQINRPDINYIRLDHPVSYYADNQFGFGANFPKSTSGAVLHALQKLDEAGFDFAPYGDAENKTHNLIVIYAGSPFDGTKDPAAHLQQSSYALVYSDHGPFVSSGGQEINIFAACAEQKYTHEERANLGP